MNDTKWEYLLKTNNSIKDRLMVIRNMHNLKDLKDTIIYAINATYEADRRNDVSNKNI